VYWRVPVPSVIAVEVCCGCIARGCREKRAPWPASRFSFWSIDKFPARRRAIHWEILLRRVKGHDSGARVELIMGHGRRFEARRQRLFPEPLPVIGVRRGIVQNRAHDDSHRTALFPRRSEIMSATGAFAPLRPVARSNEGCFSKAENRWIRGLRA
jgi:hypothetical protein